MRLIVWLFAAAYGIALAALAISATGLLGAAEDPLSGLLLLPLGLPWNVVMDRLGVSETAALVLAPAVNLALLIALRRFLERRRT